MSIRLQTLLSFVLVAAMGSWLATLAQTPSAGKKKNTQKGTPQSAAAKKNKADTGQPASPVVIDVSTWPADNTVTIRLMFGLADAEPTSWDGRIVASDARILRVRPWRFGPEMTVDAQSLAWKCGTWQGPVPADRLFDRHLPDVPRPFVQSGVLIDLAGDLPVAGSLNIETVQGKISVELEGLQRTGGLTVLNGKARADLAVFGFPVAARTESGQRTWYDDPALAARGGAEEEVAVSYLAYSQETTSDAIYVRRRTAGTWQSVERVSQEAGDHYRSAVCFDSRGGLWVAYAAQIEGNWDLFARRRSEGRWGPVTRLTRDPQPDFQHQLVADGGGGMWLVWQGFRGGRSDVLARHWNGREWGDEERVSDSPANDWHPSAAPLPQGGIAVAWDTYDAGNYDVRCRSVSGSPPRWGDVVRVASSEQLEARPTIAADAAGRLWVAYDTGGAHWGKDTGFQLELARALQGTRLYEGRGIEVAMVEPGSNRVLAPSDPVVDFATRNPTLQEQLEYPQLVADGSGRMWLVMRRRAMLSVSRRGVGRMFGWDVLVSQFDPLAGRWTEPQVAADSLGRLDSLSGVAAGPAGLWLAWSHDHRVYSTNRPDASSIFAGQVMSRGNSATDVASAAGSPRASRPTGTPPPAHPNEAADVERIRSHAVMIGNKTYHIFRGDMHRHTETSSDGGGDGSMLDVYRYALDAAAMDFLLVTDHHDGDREYDWWRREKFNDLFRVGEAFTGLFGYERSVRYPNGHRNVFFVQRGVRPLANFPQESGRDPVGTGRFLYPHLREYGGICFSHTSATGMGTDWRDNDAELEPLVEIFQGDRTNYEKLAAPWSADANNPGTQEGGFEPLGYVNLALAKGYKLGFQASSDHLSTHLSYSCILAERNTRESLMAAMKARHAYAATDNILLDVRAAGTDGEHLMGDVFTCSGPPKVRVQIVGTGPLADVVLIKDDHVVYTTQPAGQECTFEFSDLQSEPGRESYYYVRVVQADRQIAWGSPLWITRE